MGSPKYGLLAAALVLGVTPLAWGQASTYGVGRAPTAEEVRKWDIAIGFDGKELPPGTGTAKQGETIFAQKCASCHGAKGEGGIAPVLIVPKGGLPPRPAPAAAASGAERGGAPAAAAPERGRDAMSYRFGIPGPGLMSKMAPNATILWDYINRAMPIGREGSLTPNEVYSLTAFLLYKYEDPIVQLDDVVNQQNLTKIKMPNTSYKPPPTAHDMLAPRIKGYMQAPPASR